MTQLTDGLYVEKRPFTGSDVASWDIAHHLYARQLQGTVVILTGNPAGLLSALCKQWARITRKVQRERSSTLDATMIEQLTKTIGHMQCMNFTTKTPADNPRADVYIMSNEQLKQIPFGCHTFYALERVDDERLSAIMEAMPYNGLLVYYR
jgi:hypothetical protein